MRPPKKHWNRRDFLKSLGMGAAGLSLAGREILGSPRPSGPMVKGAQQVPCPPAPAYGKVVPPARVSLVKGSDRRRIIYQALKLIEDEVLSSIGDRRIMIKPNMVLADKPLTVLHVDAMRAILDFLTPHYKKRILIGEAGVHNTCLGFQNAGYYALEKEYNVQLLDLNLEPFQYRYVLDKDNKPIPIRIISTYLDPDLYLISAAPMKTHNIVLTTLSLKNVLLGCPVNDYKNNDKGLMHTDLKTTANDVCHFNMFHLSREVFPDLAIIDGFEAMEGKGPAWGTLFEARVALAGVDALATDTLATHVMGFDPGKVNYLTTMAEAGMGQGDLSKIRTLGTPLAECLYHFKVDEKTAEIYGLGSDRVI